MLYFDHDTSASTDPKIIQLRLECGGAAVDAYWYLIEQMHREEHGVCVGNAAAMRVHCHTLCTEQKYFEKYVKSMISIGLLESDDGGEIVYSSRALDNISEYQTKRQKASSAAKSRWDNANAKQPQKRKQCERNANGMPIKEKKSSNTTRITTPLLDASGDAATGKTAPPYARKALCPMCEKPTWKDSLGVHHCDTCHDTYAKEKVVWL